MLFFVSFVPFCETPPLPQNHTIPCLPRSRRRESSRLSDNVANPPRVRLPLDSPRRRRLPLLLRRAWYGLNQAFRRKIAHTGVTPDQFTAMRTLLEGDQEGMTQRELTLAMSSDPNTVASLLERMEASGWIERVRHEKDRRAYRIRMLQSGYEKFLVVRDLAVALQSDILETLPGTDREKFLEQLEAVAIACRRAADQSKFAEESEKE